jgi:hypothetical protein
VYRDDGRVTITLPDGTTANDDQALSDWLGRPVTIRTAAEPGDRVFENPADFERDALLLATRKRGSPGPKMGPTGGPTAITSGYQRHASEAQLSPLLPMRMSSQAGECRVPKGVPAESDTAIRSHHQRGAWP